MKTNDWLKWALYLGLLLVPLTLFPVFSSLFFPFITSKVFLFRILVEILLFLWIVLALRDPAYRPRMSGIMLAIVGFIVVILLSGFLGEDFSRSFWSNYERMIGIIGYLHFFVLFLVMGATLRTRKQWHGFFGIWLAFSLVIAFDGFREVVSLTRIDSVLGNPIYLAGYSMLNAFLAAYLVEDSIKNHFSPFLSWFYGFVGVVNVVVLFFTGTRGSILALLGGVFLIALLIAIFEKKRKLLRKFGVLVCVVFLALPLIFVAIKDTPIVQESSTLSRFADISVSSGTGGARLDLWRMSLGAFSEHPLLGYGMGNYGLVFADYYSPELYDDEAWFDRAHSVFFNFLVVIGIIGLFAYFCLYLSTLLSLWELSWLRKRVAKYFPSVGKKEHKVRKKFTLFFKDRESEEFTTVGKSILTGLLAAYFVHLLFVFGDTTTLIIFFAVLAFVHNRISRNRPSFLGEKVPYASTQAITSVIVLVLTLGVLYFVNYLPLRQNIALMNAMYATNTADEFRLYQVALSYDTFGEWETRERVVLHTIEMKENGAPEVWLSKYFALSKKAVAENIRARPDDPRSYYFQSILFSTFGKNEEALKSINKAIALSPTKQQFLEVKTKLLLNLGKYDQAVKTARKTLDLLQKNDTAANYYAVALIYADKEDKAKAFLKKRYGVDVPVTPLFIRAYSHAGEYQTIVKIRKRQLEATPDSIKLRLALAAVYIKLGEREKADQLFNNIVEIFEERIEESPGEPKIRMSFASFYLRIGRPEEAIKVFQAVALKWPQASGKIQELIDDIRSGDIGKVLAQ